MRRHGFLAITLAGAVACSAWFLNQHHPLDASEETNRSFREAFRDRSDTPEPVEDEEGIRLNFFESDWSRVLKDVAKQGQLTLVMDKIPHGSFARRDRNRYQVESAVRILNADLETQGFRLLHQGNYLVVLKLDHARTRYSRPALNEWQSLDKSRASAASDRKDDRRSPFMTASARKEQDSPQVAWASQQTEKRSPFADTVVPQPQQPTAEQQPQQEEGPAILKSIEVEHGKASEIARSIYLVFESRAELIGKGLQGLPTFVVQRSADKNEANDDGPLFQVGIDQANNSLIIEASKVRAEHLTRLIAEMDKPANEKAETVKIVPNKGVSDVTAKDLNEQIHRMVAMRTQDDQAPAGNQESDNPLAGDAGSESSMNLRGDVNVQAMQDLGILILKGNEADVLKVELIIKQLEEMSVGSLPDIHLLALKYVNSEAMAELLTNVYEQLTELRNRGNNDRQAAAFVPVVQPNAILIISPAIELEAILALADELDRQTDPEAEFKVFTLRNAIASQVSASINTFYEERDGLGTQVRVVPDVRTNAIIVQGRTNDLNEIGKLIERFDIDEPGAVHRVEIVELKHATATELADIINTAIQSVSSPPQQVTTGGGGGFGGNQGSQELQEAKSAALEFLTTTGGGRELIRSGILVDVRINADPRSNSLIISAPEASMPLLKALAQQLDLPPSAVASIKVFALQNADAAQSVDLLTSLFEDQNQEDQLGVQIDGTQGSASSLIPVQFSADIRTNTVLAVGGEESLSVVEAILLRLDTAESRQRRTEVIPMRNVLASVVADALEAFLEQQQALQDSSEDLISNIERMRQEVIVAADDNSNSLIVSASPEYFGEISQIINELDANPPQVIIQALLVEVQLDNTDEFGVELGFQDPLLFSRGLIDTIETITQTGLDPVTGFTTNNQTVVSANGNPGFNFNNTATGLGNNVAGLLAGQNGTAPGTVASQGISNFSLGRQNGDLGFGGFVFSAQSDAVSVLVRALAARRTVHVLSRPQIRTTHNNTASIQVGQQVPVVNGVAVTDNFVTPEIIQQDVGIILRVTPRVTPDGTISMEVYAEKSSLSGGGVPVFTDVTTGNVVESVIIDSAIADTTVTIPNGQTIVIGGMITKSDETLERKVPWLGDLPLIGKAFRYDGTNTARTELLIFLTPRIIYGDADSELIKQVEAERMHFVESEAEEIHGPLYSVPPSGVDRLPMPTIDMMPQGSPIPVEDYSVPPSDGSVILPPQVKSNAAGRKMKDDRDAVASKLEATAVANRNVVTASGSGLDPQVYQALAESAEKQGEAEAKAEKAAAVEWVRKAVEKKNEKTAQASGSRKAVESTNESSKKVNPFIQAGTKRPTSESLRTLSTQEAALDETTLQKTRESKPSWASRLRW